MNVDIGNCLAPVASPGISRVALDKLDEQVATAHEQIMAGREANATGYRALDLPMTTDAEAIRSTIAPVADAETVLTIGIGGSALGAATVTDALVEPSVRHYQLDNADPEYTTTLLDRLSLEDTALHVVSRSGTTAETLANFLVVRDAMDDAGVDWTAQTVVTTGEHGPLRNLVDRHDLPWLSVPDGVPGRYSVLSNVGLLPAAILGQDIESILTGAKEAAENLSGSLYDTPSYAYGAVAVALARRGVSINVMMPYVEALESFAEWFAQLWAESLGKDGLGQAPVRALGTTDQHSQLQLYRAGPRNAMVTFLRTRDRPDYPIPTLENIGIEYLEEATLGQLLDAEFEATEASLAEAGRPNVRIELERLDPNALGNLLYSLEAACILAGELMSINPFDQPAVEWGKTAVQDLLSGEDTEAARSVNHKTTLRIS